MRLNRGRAHGTLQLLKAPSILAAVKIVDCRAILGLDIGFYKGITVWDLPFGLPIKFDRSSYGSAHRCFQSSSLLKGRASMLSFGPREEKNVHSAQRSSSSASMGLPLGSKYVNNT